MEGMELLSLALKLDLIKVKPLTPLLPHRTALMGQGLVAET